MYKKLFAEYIELRNDTHLEIIFKVKREQKKHTSSIPINIIENNFSQ